MGWRYEVHGWTKETPVPGVYGEYRYKPLYQGQSLVKALWVALRSTSRYGCVKLEMR